MDFLLVIAISVCLAFILVYCKKNFFVKKAFYAAPNTSRGFALLADFIVFNSINFVYILFVSVQFAYLFSGDGEMPFGLNHAEYARKGFFELLAVTMINLSIFLFGTYFPGLRVGVFQAGELRYDLDLVLCY